MIDHIGINVEDYEKSKAFYKAALAPLGYELLMEVEGWAGFGAGGKPDFWIGAGSEPCLACTLRSTARTGPGSVLSMKRR